MAFTRLAQQFPDGPYLDYARRAAQYLIYQRDGNVPEAGQVPREDHWLTLALSELYRLDPRDEYRQVAYLQADTMIANQHPPEGLPIADRRLVAADPHQLHLDRHEGRGARCSLGARALRGGRAEEERISSAALRNLQFQLRVQYTAENTQLLPRPEAAIGAWGKDAVDPWIRIDFVQHNISGLLAMAFLALDGDIPLGALLD